MIARELLVKLGFNIDQKKLDRFSSNIESLKSQIQDLRVKIGTSIEPNSNVAQLIAYKKELQELGKQERLEIEELNKAESLRAKADTKRNRQKLRELVAIKSKLQDTENSFKRAGRAAVNANQTFSRFFSRFAFASIGAIGLNLRNTLKDAKDFKEGKVNKASGGFSKEQINTIDRFNNSLLQTRRIINSIRNNIVTEMLPSIRDYLNELNRWLVANREVIKLKVKEFIATISKAFKSAYSVFKNVISVLDPLVQLIGGWSTILTGFIGAGILSWIVRLGVFLGRAAKAIIFATTAIRTLSLALLTNPITLTISAISGAFALLSNEIYITQKGGDSLINRFAPLRSAFDITRIVIEGFVDGLKEAWRWLALLADKIKDLSFNAFDKVTGFFKEPMKIKLIPELSNSNIFEEIKESENGLKIFSVKNRSKTFRNIEPRSISPSSVSSSVSNKNTRNVINNKNNINLSVNLPEGTSEKQAKEITKLVESRLLENNQQNNLETLNAIGVY
jgi:hypothetical protein